MRPSLANPAASTASTIRSGDRFANGAASAVAIIPARYREALMSTILVTGGAGYIGSHVARQLGERGESLVTLDDLSSGFKGAVLHGEFVQGDAGDAALLASLLEKHRIETVMHFAAHIQVPESVANPLKYYRNNTANTGTLL